MAFLSLYHTGVHHSYTACLSAGASLDFQNSVDVIFSSILPCKKYGNQLSVFPELCHYIYILHDEPDGVYLISLNQKYRPIQVLESDSFKIFGKVIGKCKGAEIPGFH